MRIQIVGSKISGQKFRSAFTLVEVLISAAIGAIIFAALYCGIANSTDMVQTSRMNLRATQIMVSQMEGLRLCAWGTGTNLPQLFNTTIVPPAFTNYFYPVGMNGTTNLGATYYGTMSVTPMTNAAAHTNLFGGAAPSYATNMALVTVTVSWTDGLYGHQVTHHRHMSTFVAEYGIQNYVYSH